MAQDRQARVIPAVAATQRLVRPTQRDLRGQAVQRLQVGLFGLAAMLLMVGLANIVMDRAREAEAQEPLAEATPVAGEKQPATDALADIGVAPAATPTPQPDAAVPAGGSGN